MKALTLSQNLADEKLIQLYKETNNTQIIGVLFNRYAAQIKGLCMKYLKDDASSDDAVMDIFEQLVQKIGNYQIKTFKTWIFCVTKNYCLKQFRKRQFHQPVDAMAETLAAEIKEEHTDNGRIIALGNAINRLKPQQRQCIELFFFQKLSYAEISELVKCDIKKVKSHIQNGKLRLRHMLAA